MAIRITDGSSVENLANVINEHDDSIVNHEGRIDELENATPPVAPVQSVAGKTGDVTVTKSDVGLGNVSNTADADKPISNAQAVVNAAKVDKVTGSSLIPDAKITKLDGIATGATANDTDANLKNRANHTGVQAASTITPDATRRFTNDTDIAKLALLSTNQNSSLGTWNASTNTPALTTNPSPAVQGQEYTISVAGTQSITGASVAFGVGDKIKSNGTAWVRIPYVGVGSAEITAIKSVLPYDISVYPNPTRQIGYYSSANGTFVAGVTPYSGYLLIRSSYGEKIYVSAHIKDAGTALAVYLGTGDAFLGNQFVGTTQDVEYIDQLLTIPEGTLKIGITEFSNTPSLVIKSGNVSTNILTKKTGDATYSQLSPLQKQVKLQLTSASNIVLYSSSISSSDYPWYVESMNQLTQANVLSRGISGYNAQQATGSLDQIFTNNPNLIVLEVGANDAGEVNTVGTFGAFAGEPVVVESDISIAYNGTRFIQAIDYIVRKISAQYYDIRTRASLTGSETEAQKTAKIDAVLKPYFVFLTGFPQKRQNSGTSFSNVENQLRKRNAIIEVCAKNNVHCIDMYKLLEWDMSKEPFWPGTTDKLTNNGIYTMDGLHPNKYGFQQISRIICGQIGIV